MLYSIVSKHIKNGVEKQMSPNTLTNKIENELELLKRHVTILKVIMENEPIGIIKLSEILKYPQHKVRYSLRTLEHEGLIEPSPEGAVTTEELPAFLSRMKVILGSMDQLTNDLTKSLKKGKKTKSKVK